MKNIVYIHISPSEIGFKSHTKWVFDEIPDYTFKSIHNTRLLNKNSKIFLVCSQKQYQNSQSKYIIDNDNIQIVEFESLKDDIITAFINLHTRTKFDFHLITMLRYPIVNSLMKKFDIDDILFIEGDNIIYDDIGILDSFMINDGLYCCGFCGIDSYSSGIFVCNNREILNNICTEALRLLYIDMNVTDMTILPLLQKLLGTIYTFPELPNETDKGILFDPATYGQYLGGDNHLHEDSFIDKNHLISQKLLLNNIFSIIRENNKYYLSFDNKKYKFFNLHIHNKLNIDKFLTYIDSDYIDGDFFESFKKNSNIIYSDSDKVEQTLNNSTKHKILITHNGDRNITEELYQKCKSTNKFDIWYAQNVSCKHDDLLCIPIGLERKRWCSFNKWHVMQWCKQHHDKNKKGVLYGNFSVGTNDNKRTECLNYFKDKEYFTNKVTYKTPQVSKLTQEQYIEYCNDILDHKYVLCPEGNGIDTHRLWETLYLGSIPVVLHNNVNDSFKDMPIMILNNWNEFEDNYQNFTPSYIYDKLYCNYWYNQLTKDI